MPFPAFYWQLLSKTLRLPGFLLLSNMDVLNPTPPPTQKQKHFFKTLNCRQPADLHCCSLLRHQTGILPVLLPKTFL